MSAEPIPPSAAQLDRAQALLLAALGSKVLIGSECEAYRTDDSRIEGAPPCAVVLAESESDLAKALTVARETRIPITPRAGGSGRTGGAVPVLPGIVLSCSKMNRLLDLDRSEGLVICEPGVILSDLHQSVEAEGWFYPPDPNSSELCCIAGNLAENAAGPRAHKYGSTRDYVLGVEALLSTGESFFAGRRTKKGVTGYDVTSTLVGSEGTLAVFGRATLRLLPRPEAILTLLSPFASTYEALKAVETLIAARVQARCIEFLDEKTLAVMREENQGIRPEAGALLLIEVDGEENACLSLGEKIGNLLSTAGALEVVVAQSDAARAKLWASRKAMSYAVRRRAAHKVSEDVVVPRRHLGTLVEFVGELGQRSGIDALSYGHAGDGNLHVNFLWNHAEEVAQVDACTLALFEKVVALGGTLSGEHGIGLLKAPYLGLEQSEELIAVQKRIKQSFDPLGILNPGKIFPRRGHGAC